MNVGLTPRIMCQMLLKYASQRGLAKGTQLQFDMPIDSQVLMLRAFEFFYYLKGYADTNASVSDSDATLKMPESLECIGALISYDNMTARVIPWYGFDEGPNADIGSRYSFVVQA